MYLRSTRCAFQSLPWCGAAVCDPISRLCAWTNAGVTSMGYISIFISHLNICFAFMIPLHQIHVEDLVRRRLSGPNLSRSSVSPDLNLVIWSLHITHVIFSHHGRSRSLRSSSHEGDKHRWRFMEEVNLLVMGYWFLWMYFPRVISPKENSSPSDALFVTGL